MNFRAAGSQRLFSGSSDPQQPHFRRLRVSGLVAALLTGAFCMLSSSALAVAAVPNLASFSDDDAADAPQKAPNSRAVRLSYVESDVSVVQDGEVIANPALANLPLFEGSEISTGNEGRAEIQFDDGSVARLSPNTTLAITVLQQQGASTRTEVVMNSGLGYFELQPSTSEHSMRVNYGSAAFAATSFSVVRIIGDEPPASLAVFSGNVHLTVGVSSQLDIHSGQSVTLDGNNLGSQNLSESIEPDSWDGWNSDRDQLLNSEAADKTAATSSLKGYPDAGLSDLDANGNWYDVPGQGYVWSPYDAQLEGASWDPYGYGHWVYYPRYGYIWVSDYRWGYMPYQCGLWNFYDNFGWGWVPGGGCNPWWGGGFYGGGYYGGGGGWGFRLGNHPPGYHPPRRPLPGPIHPHPGPGPRPVQNPRNITRVHEGPVKPPVGVDHRSITGSNPPVTGRPAAPVTIGGRTVEPLRPVVPRETYGRTGDGFVNRSAPRQPGQPGQFTGTGHPPVNPRTPAPGMPTRPVTGQPGYRPYTPPPASRPQPPPSRPAPVGGGGGGGHPVGGGGGGAPHSAPAPAPHK